MSGIDAKSDAIYDLVAEGAAVEQLATGFIFTEGPIWHAEERVRCSSPTCPATRRRGSEAEGVSEEQAPVVQVQRDESSGRAASSSASTPPARLRARARRGGERRRSPRHYQGKQLNSPNDVTVALGRHDLLQRPAVRACRASGSSATRARLPGRLPDRARRRRARAASARTSSRCRTGCASRPTSRCSTSTTRRARTSASFDVAADGSLPTGVVFAGVGDGAAERGDPPTG